MNIFRIFYPEPPPPKPSKTKKVKKKKTNAVKVNVQAKSDSNENKDDNDADETEGKSKLADDLAATDEELSQPQPVTLDKMEPIIHISASNSLNNKIEDPKKTMTEMRNEIDLKGQVMRNMEEMIAILTRDKESLVAINQNLRLESTTLKGMMTSLQEENNELKEQIRIMQQSQCLLNNQYQSLQTSSSSQIQQLSDKIAALSLTKEQCGPQIVNTNDALESKVEG